MCVMCERNKEEAIKKEGRKKGQAGKLVRKH